MNFFDYFKSSPEPEPELDVVSEKQTPIEGKAMLITELLQAEQKLNTAVNNFKAEEVRQGKLSPANDRNEYNNRLSNYIPLREAITNNQNEIKNILRDNNITKRNNPDIYNMYVDGMEVADENYTNNRLDALNNYLNNPQALKEPPPLPTVQQMQQSIDSRRNLMLGEENAGILPGLALGAKLVGGNALSGAVSGVGGAGLAGEPLAEEEVGGSGQLGGQQKKSGTGQRAGPEGRERGARRDDDNDGIPNYLDPEPNKAPPRMDFLGGVEGVAGENQQRPKETSLSADEGIPTNVPPAVPSVLPSGSDILEGVRDTLGLSGRKGRGDTGKMGGLQETSFDATGHSRPAQNPAPNKSDSHIQQTRPNVQHIEEPSFDAGGNTDPFIEAGVEREVPDFKIFSNVLGATASLAFEAIKPSVITNPAMLLTVEFLEQFSPYGIKDSVESAVNAIVENAYTDVGNLKATAPNRMKLRMGHEEHTVFKNPILYPFVVVAINFYLARTDREGIQLNDLTYNALYYLLTYNLKVDAQHTDYLLQLFKNYPTELSNAFIKNRDSINQLNQEEINAIDAYINSSIQSYESIFNRKFRDDTKKYENGGTALLSILRNLDNPRLLFEVNQVFKTADNFLLSIQDNKDILIGLMGLVYSEARGRNLLSREAILNSAMVDGIVYYNRGIPLPVQKRNIDIDVLEQLSNPQGRRNVDGFNIEYESDKLGLFTNANGDSILAFRGTDLKDKADIKQNFLNMAGSPAMFRDAEYSDRYDKARELIDNKLRQIANTGRGSLNIVGNSLGGIGAIYMSILYPSVPTRVYQPVVGRSAFTDAMFKELKDRNSLITFNAVSEDPFSSNLKNYKDDFEINYVLKSKFFDSHNLKNFLN